MILLSLEEKLQPGQSLKMQIMGLMDTFKMIETHATPRRWPDEGWFCKWTMASRAKTPTMYSTADPFMDTIISVNNRSTKETLQT